MAARPKRPAMSRVAEPYQHTQETPMRPEVGIQAQFKKRKAPKTYRYDSSLDPALSWDDGAGAGGARAMGEWLLGLIVEASKLPAPHRFPTPKRFLGAGNAVLMTVNGLEDAVKELQGLGREGRAAFDRRADASAIYSRAAFDAGDSCNTQGP